MFRLSGPYLMNSILIYERNVDMYMPNASKNFWTQNLSLVAFINTMKEIKKSCKTF